MVFSVAGSPIHSSAPARPPAFPPYVWRSWSRTGRSEGYFSAVSSTPSRSTALTGGAAGVPARSFSSLPSCGWMTEGCQSTTGFPLVRPRTTVSLDAYDSGLVAPSYVTSAATVNGTVVPVAAPGVITALDTYALAR